MASSGVAVSRRETTGYDRLCLRHGGFMTTLRRLFHAYRVDLTTLLVVTIWGISAPVRKAALAQFDVLPFTALRFLEMLVLSWDVLCGRTTLPQGLLW
jgi:hypothetical protein